MNAKRLALAIAAAAAAGSALATGPGAEKTGSVDERAAAGSSETATEEFSRLDADGDGSLSREESGTNPALAEGYDDIDANQDGSIDRAEFSAFEKEGAAPMGESGERTGGRTPSRAE